MKNDYAMLIMTGGKGSRMSPLTDNMPKSNLPIYYKDNNIVRIIDIPIDYCKKNNIKMFVALDYKKEKLDYLKSDKSISFIETHTPNLAEAILKCLYVLKENGIKYYSIYASDFLIPSYVIDNMLDYSNNYKLVALCTKDSPYTKVNVPCNEKYEFDNNGKNQIKDLTFHINSVDNSIKWFEKLLNQELIDMWKFMYEINVLESVKLYLADITNIDLGTPEAYYEALYKINKDHIDESGNIVFPNAKINEKSRGVIALPNSDTSDEIIYNSIVEENSKSKILKIGSKKIDYFKDIKIEDYIKSKD